MKHVTIIVIILTVTLTACPLPASANWKRFIPRPAENRGDLDLFVSYEKESGKGGVNDVELTDTIFKEKLTLYSDGFVYHPRFIQYVLTFSGNLRHENIENSSTGSGDWKNLGGILYSGTMILLPEHHYNLELFARRSEPVLKQGRSRNESTSEGAMFRYRKKPYFFNTSYIVNNLESTGSSSDETSFIVSGAYYQQDNAGNLLSMDMGYNHSDFNSSLQLEGGSDTYSLGTSVQAKNANSTFSLSKGTLKQRSPFSGSLENEQFSWAEHLNVDLPLNFKAGTSYSYFENSFNTGALGTFLATERLNITNTFDASISHRLYRSLNNSYSFRRTITDSTAGDSDGTTHGLTTGYTKRIPHGNLTAGLNLSSTVTDSSGAVNIINEPHSAGLPVPGTFALNSQRVDPGTIRVFLRSPLPPSELIPLVEGINFRVVPFGNTFQITDILIADVLPSQVDADGTFEFLVDYSLVSEKLRLLTEAAGYNIGFSLIKNMLNPYYSYTTVKSEVLAGTLPGDPLDSETRTIGIIFEKDPVSARSEYQKVDSNIAPYTAWRNEIGYDHSFSETASGSVVGEYTHTTYPEGTSVGDQGYSVNTSSISANVRKRVPEKRLLLSGGVAYAATNGLVDASAYSLNSSLVWRIGKLIVNLGASASSSESKSTLASSVKTEKIHQYYYLNVKRQLF